jgi:predicted lipoprotein with Yx(FWY)xxD motif
MKQLLMLGAALAASIVVAACGGGSSESAAPASGGGRTVAVRSMDGIGKVLVDSSGRALYASDVEADGKVHWTSSSFWRPLTIDSGKPTAAAGVGKLGVIKRPDGSRQVTVNGRLLYTFTEDSAGKAAGNGFSDDSNGEHFTWNAVLAGGKVASSSGSPAAGSSSQGGGSSGQDGYQYNPGG